MSIWEEIEKVNKTPVKSMTDEELKQSLDDVFSSLATDGIASGKRKFVIHTGAEGMRQINRQYEIHNALDMCDRLIKKGNLTQDEKDGLAKLLHSADHESFNLAIFIIKAKQNEVNIYSRKS